MVNIISDDNNKYEDDIDSDHVDIEDDLILTTSQSLKTGQTT